jgi:hypothetical protein
MRAWLTALVLLFAAAPAVAQDPQLDSLKRADSIRMSTRPCTTSERFMGICRALPPTDTIYLRGAAGARRSAGRRVDTVFVNRPEPVDTVYVDRRTGREVPPPAASGPAPVRPANWKDGGTATLFGLLITGGGHFYAGEGGKGAMLLLLGTAGLGVAVGSECYDSCTAPAVGLGVYFVTALISIFDAAPAARRHNEREGLVAARPLSLHMKPGGGRVQVGLSVPLGP